ncbi:DUF4139 domain-containing protein [Nitrospira lenta]|uniref:DUF4139 domain-containing protein n=1 Tax=Nitrospira lenta TaxID=1436998 RepID=A0A330L805_9BACT|nr:DUF4139 domain-containing protein [Nitrospira lenta]SPP65381.1 conserved exported hypothetical protein [Nitrospira lenta]
MRPSWRTILTPVLLSCAGLFALGTPPLSLAEDTAGSLPLSKIILYSSGVGYFQHDGTVTDRTQWDLRLQTNQINDLLKSLVVQDFGGGKISTVTYGSRDPITKTLGSFGINLNGNPTLGQILTQIRGERVEVTAPNPLLGTILGVEKKTESLSDGQSRRTIEQEYLNLLTDDGFRSLPFAQIQRVKLLDAGLNAELQQALVTLAGQHDAQRKTVSIVFDGTGRRPARVAYLTETPVWKTTYRLVLDEEHAPYLQGWAIVENQTHQDWKNVTLSLISGRPISFTMDLYRPLYNPRPVVEPELYANLKPQTYGDALDEAKSSMPAATSPARSDMKKERLLGKLAEGYASAPSEMAMADDREMGRIDQGVTSMAMTEDKGELFEYRLDQPVTLDKHQSALLPIIGQSLQGQKVAVYNPSANATHPLHGYRLKNSSTLHLMQGPITVFDGGAYAGDAQIYDLAPGQDRLISYALDLKTEVEPKIEGGTQELVTVSLKKGTMLVSRRLVEDRTYLVKNRDQKPRTVLIEHPYRADWKLVEPKDATERTRDLYRFSIAVAAGKTATLRVKETLPIQESILLMESGLDQIAYFQQAKEVSAKVKEALHRVVHLRSKLDEARAQRTRLEQRIGEITAEHGRIRENMQRLQQNSDLHNRYVKKLDQQETELEKLRKEIEALKTTEEERRQELQTYVMSLDLA